MHVCWMGWDVREGGRKRSRAGGGREGGGREMEGGRKGEEKREGGREREGGGNLRRM